MVGIMPRERIARTRIAGWITVDRTRQAKDGNEVIAEWHGTNLTLRLFGVYRANPPRLLPIGGGPATLIDDACTIRGVVVSATVSRIAN